MGINWSLVAFLADLLEQEIEGRRMRRIERWKKAAHLPFEKALAAFNTIYSTIVL